MVTAGKLVEVDVNTDPVGVTDGTLGIQPLITRIESSNTPLAACMKC